MACDLTLNQSSFSPRLNVFCGDEGESKLAMGLGAIANANFKRKFRWTFELQYCCSSQDPKYVGTDFVKVGARPQIDIEETEINYLNGKFWIPGKATWNEMAITYYDVAGSTNASLLSWIATIYDFRDPVCLPMNSTPSGYSGFARLVLWDGCGNPLEAWLLGQVWPKAVNWGDLDMSSSEECTIEITLRYGSVQYVSYCGGTIETCPCTPCAQT